MASQDPKLLDRIKGLAVQAMFSDDELLEQLVLKGGNAMALVHRISARASVDLDFSLRQDFGEGFEKVGARIEKTLRETPDSSACSSRLVGSFCSDNSNPFAGPICTRALLAAMWSLPLIATEPLLSYPAKEL
ncbi:hypothetical protein EVC45_30975 [Paraburkholderia sp. UYCP14C]|nr:hypothetical protein EVC45_30975 [Paraburkholderia sp. UYCP14C]